MSGILNRIDASEISDSTPAGRAILTAADAEAQRAALHVRDAQRLSDFVVSDTDLSLDGATVGSDQTAAIQAILDLAATAPLELIWDVRVSVTGLKIRSNTIIRALPGCGAKLRNNSNKPLLGNYNPTPGTVIDENITICGGTWNGNGPNQSHDTPEEGWIVCIRLMGVRNVILRDMQILKPRTFSVHFANWLNVVVDSLHIDVGSSGSYNFDGLHFNGPGRYLYVRNLDARTDDDAIALNCNDVIAQGDGAPNVYLPYAGPGDISDVLIDGVHFADSNFGIRLLTSTNRLDRVVIKNVTGRTARQWLLIDNYDEDPWRMGPPGEGNFGSIIVDGAHVDMVNGGYKNSGIYCNAPVEKLSISNYHRGDFTIELPSIKVGPAARIQNLSIQNYVGIPVSGNNFANQFIIEGEIRNLTIANSIFGRNDGAGVGYPVSISGKVTQLFDSNNSGAGFAGFHNITGTVTHSHISNSVMDAVASTWALDAGVQENRYDPGMLTVSPPDSVPTVGQKSSNDDFSGDVLVTARFNLTGANGNRSSGLFVRGTNAIPWSSHTAYTAMISTFPGQGVTLYKGVSGADTPVAALATSNLVGGVEYRLFFSAKNSGGNVVLALKIQRVSDGYWLTSADTWVPNTQAGQVVLTYTDTSSVISGAGRCGVISYVSSGHTDPINIRNFSVAAAP